MRFRVRLLILIILMLPLLLSGQRIFYFDADSGNDANAGTKAAPKQNVAWINSNAQAYDVYFLAAGDTFDDARFQITGVDGVTVTSYGTANGGKAIVNSATTTAFNVRSDFLLVHNIHMDGLNTQGFGVWVATDGTGLTVQNCLVEDFVTNGFSADNAAVATGVCYLNNIVQNNGNDGYGAEAAMEVLIKGGTVSGHTNAASDAVSFHDNARGSVENLTMTGNTDGVHHVTASGPLWVKDCHIANNPAGGSRGSCILIEPGAGGGGDATNILYLWNTVMEYPATGPFTTSDAMLNLYFNAKAYVGNCTFSNRNTQAQVIPCIKTNASTVELRQVTNCSFLVADNSAAYVYFFASNTQFGIFAHNAYQTAGLASNLTPYRYNGVLYNYSGFRTASGLDARGSFELADLGYPSADFTTLDNARPEADSPLIGTGSMTGGGYQLALAEEGDYDGNLRTNRRWDIGPFASSSRAAPTGPTISTAAPGVYTTGTTMTVAIATDPTPIEVTRFLAGTVADRRGARFNRLQISSPTTATVKFKVGYDMVPAEDPLALGVYDSGAVTVFLGGSSPSEFLAPKGRTITSISAISSTDLTDVVLHLSNVE